MALTDQAVQVARTLLASELGCQVDEIQILTVEAMEWSDSSLGCPQPGMMYMQVITPGYRVVLEYETKHYTVHTDQGRRAVRCDRPFLGQSSRNPRM